MNCIKNNFIKKLIITFVSIVILIGISIFLFILDINEFAKEPNKKNSTQKIIFNINRGDTLAKVSFNLKNLSIIDNDVKFKILAKIRGIDKKIQAGEYILSSAMEPNKILEAFVKGKIKLYKITVPEGFNLKEIGDKLGKSGICKKDLFLKYAYDKSLLKKYSINAKSFEGYLFPETYLFRKNANPKEIIAEMTRRFYKVYNEDYKKRAKEIGFNRHEIITLASIIEKETGQGFERPVISSVFHNRLKKRMRLETDPTVIYGLKNFNGNITRKDLRKKTPYNTYLIKGLPPGPIASPGNMSIRAALYPDKTQFLFFVSKKDGTHYFSKTLREHNNAVRKYQLRR